MRKSDYMKLSKSRLAELLEERDTHDYLASVGSFNPSTIEPCWSPNGYCSNPYRDCVNCPRDWSKGTVISTIETTAGFKMKKD